VIGVSEVYCNPVATLSLEIVASSLKASFGAAAEASFTVEGVRRRPWVRTDGAMRPRTDARRRRDKHGMEDKCWEKETWLLLLSL